MPNRCSVSLHHSSIKSVWRNIMDVKRILIAIALIAVMFGFVSFSQPQSVKASVTYGPFNGGSPDSGTCGNNWGQDVYKYTLVYDVASGNGTIFFVGSGTTFAGPSPNACNAGPNNGKVVAAGVPYGFTGDMDFELKPGTVPNATCVPTTGSYSNWFKQCSNDAGYQVASQYFVFRYQVVCDTRSWQNASQNKGGNQGDISGGLPAACPKPAESQPESCNANSVVLAPYVGHRVRVYLVQASGRQELQFEGSNFVEAGKANGQNTGKVSVVFYPNSDSWREFEGETLLVTVQGYRDGWYWLPKDSGGHLFCDWKPAPGANAK